jgi:hypothetical protein
MRSPRLDKTSRGDIFLVGRLKCKKIFMAIKTCGSNVFEDIDIVISE